MMENGRAMKLRALSILLTIGIASSATIGHLEAASGSTGPTIVDWNLDASQVKASCKAGLVEARASFAALVANKAAPTFENTVLVLENISSDLNDKLVAQTFLSQVSPRKDVRDASVDCANEGAAFGAES